MALRQGQVDRETSAALYGDDAAQSDYTFKRAILDVTPDSVSLFTPKRRAIQGVIFFHGESCDCPGVGEQRRLFRQFKGVPRISVRDARRPIEATQR